MKQQHADVRNVKLLFVMAFHRPHQGRHRFRLRYCNCYNSASSLFLLSHQNQKQQLQQHQRNCFDFSSNNNIVGIGIMKHNKIRQHHHQRKHYQQQQLVGWYRSQHRRRATTETTTIRFNHNDNQCQKQQQHDYEVSSGIENQSIYDQTVINKNNSDDSMNNHDTNHVNDSKISSPSSILSYNQVKDIIEYHYPTKLIEERNAMSRTDGYWPFIQKGISIPPKQYTYGEYDFDFFTTILNEIPSLLSNHNSNNTSHDETNMNETNNKTDVSFWNNKVFVDLGSGVGRLVTSTALLYPNMKLCRGIEILSSLSQYANQQLQCVYNDTTTNMTMISPIELICDSFLDPYIYFGDADLIFVFSSCMDQLLLEQLASSIGRQCRINTIVITTDYSLPLHGTIEPISNNDTRIPSGIYQYEIIKKMNGYCNSTGGYSTVYIHRLIQSCWDDNDILPIRYERPILSIHDIAYNVIIQCEMNQLTDTKAFIRNVYNNMIFYNIPSRFYPKSMK